MPRFVILEHDHPELHWDFMLEDAGVLKTWRLLERPQPGTSVPGEMSFDHRLKYLDYEGPISGNRGSVIRWDGGTYEGTLPSKFDLNQTIEIDLAGIHLRGPLVFRSINGNWHFEFPS